MNAGIAIHHPAESELFDDALACELAQPAEFRLGIRTDRRASAESLLRALGQIEDLRSEDSTEERGDLPLLVQRMDAKLDLMLVLIGRLVRQSDGAPDVRPVRWSRRGIRLELGARTGAAPGASGVVCLQPSDWLPESIELPVTMLAEAATGHGGFFAWFAFADLGPGLESAMERHLFRLHRRQIAEARRER